MDVLILGIGNLLLSDEGVGVHAVRALARDYRFSAEVELLDGGTAGMGLLAPLAEAGYLIVIDAVDTGSVPGTRVRLSDEEVPALLGGSRLSPHQVGLSDVLAVARMAGTAPDSVTVFGIQPASLEPGLELTPRVAAALPGMLQQVVAELGRLGHPPEALVS